MTLSPGHSGGLAPQIVSCSALTLHILGVVQMRSRPEMPRISARGIVAGMEDAGVFWGMASVEFIDKAMDRPHPAPNAYLAVTPGATRAQPRPATILPSGTVDAGGDTIGKPCVHGASLRTACLVRDFGRFYLGQVPLSLGELRLEQDHVVAVFAGDERVGVPAPE